MNKEDLVKQIDTELAPLYVLQGIVEAKYTAVKDKVAPLIKMFFPIENVKRVQTKTPAETRIAETTVARVAVTSQFALKEGEKIPAKFKTGEVKFIKDNVKALEVLQKKAPELIATVPVYDERAYWESLTTEERKEKFVAKTPSLKVTIKGEVQLPATVKAYGELVKEHA